MILIVGLGNPGEKYIDTPHNVGFRALDCLKTMYFPNSLWEKACKSNIIEGEKDGKKVILQKPFTYMNNSGEAVTALMRSRNIDVAENVWVIHDDLDLPWGKIKIDFAKNSAGHKGVESIIEKMGTNAFWRFRVGVEQGGSLEYREDIDKYLTNNPLSYQQKKLDLTAQKEIGTFILDALQNGIKKYSFSLCDETLS